MKQMYRFLSILFVLAFILSACGAAATEAPASTKVPSATEAPISEKITLRLLTNWGPDDSKGPVLQGILDDFKKLNPNIDIIVEISTDSDIPTVVETSFLAEKEPDIIMQNLKGPSTEWVSDGVAISLSQYVKDWGLQDQFLPSALKEYTLNGDLVALPLEGFNWPMWYRTDVLAKAGLTEAPKTFAELTIFAETAREMGLQPFALGGSDWTGGDWFHTSLSSMLAPDELCTLMSKGQWSQSPKVASFVDQFIALRDAGVFIDNVEGQNFDTMNTAFFTGKAAAMHGGSWSYSELPDEMQTQVVLGGIPLPNGAYYNKPVEWAAFDAKGVFISRNGEKKIDAVKAFVTFLYTSENIARFTNETGMIPPLKSVPINNEVLKPIFVQSLSVDFESLSNPTTCAPSSLAGDPWYQILAGFFVPNTSAEQIISEMDTLYELAQ